MKTTLIMGVANKRSIAWAIAEALLEQGYQLIFTYNDERSLKNIGELMGEREAKTYLCDVTQDENIRDLFESLHKEGVQLDGLVHSIAHAKREELENPFIETSREGFHLAMDISVYSLVKIAQEAQIVLKDGAAIVAMTYLGGERVVKNYNVMGVAKAALDASIRYLANDLGERQIRVNGISAGPIRTLAARGISGFNEILGVYENRAPLKRNVSAAEVGQAAAFLLSQAASGITGEILHVDSGYSIIGY